jgi:hypothetical protein
VGISIIPEPSYTSMKFKTWMENTGGMILTAYHCGSSFDKFSTLYTGTGEGMSVLGPGIYFVTSEHIAKMYCKYAKSKMAGFYKAEIDTTNFYCFGSSWNRNAEQSKVVGERVDQIARELGYKDGWEISRTASSLTYGNAPIGGIVKKLGKIKALELFKERNIQGGLEYIQTGIVELAVYDPSVIYLKDKQELPKNLPGT